MIPSDEEEPSMRAKRTPPEPQTPHSSSEEPKIKIGPWTMPTRPQTRATASASHPDRARGSEPADMPVEVGYGQAPSGLLRMGVYRNTDADGHPGRGGAGRAIESYALNSKLNRVDLDA